MSRLLALLAALTLIVAASPATADAKRNGKVKAPRADWDRDGLNNRYERKSATKPRRADTDRDGIRDGREDRDADGVSNRTEQLARTSPRMADTDRDGVADGGEDPDSDRLVNRAESLLEWHPRKADTDGDGLRDGDENPGVISAVAGETVTIALLAGGELTATLTEFTELRCAGGGPAGQPGGPAGDEDFADDEGDDFPEDEGDDFGDDADADFGDDFEERQAAFGGCAVTVGATVHEAEVETVDGVVELLTLDLLGF